MIKLFILNILIVLLLIGCNYYTLPDQQPSFNDLGIDHNQFNTIEKITVYVETTVEAIPFQDCYVMPWDIMYYKIGSNIEKCGLFLWMAKEAGLVEDGYIVSGGDRFSNRTYYVTDGLKNPVYNFVDWMAVNTYSSETLNNYLYKASRNLCLKITVK